ncbi:MAG: FMN reductase, partial [uncultured Nocardioides sp.]
DPPHRRGDRRAEQPVLDPAARRPAHHGHDRGAARLGPARRGRRGRPPGPGPRPRRPPGDRLRDRRAREGRGGGLPGRRRDSGDAGVLRVVLRALQDVLRRARARCPGRHPGPARCDGGDLAAQPGAGARHAAAVRLPEGDRGAHRGVRRHRGLRWRPCRRSGRAHHRGRGRARRPGRGGAGEAGRGPLRRGRRLRDPAGAV